MRIDLKYQMLYFFISLLPSQASDWSEYYDDALIDKVDSTLAECSLAYGIFDDSLGNIRRRDTSKFAELEGIMKTCGAIFEAVDIFHKDPGAYEFGRSFGLITLRPSELTFLKSKLLIASKEIGDVLYVATRDGDDASNFHQACDNKGPTIVIVQTSSGAVFGGYAGESWGGDGWWRSSSDSFLFSLWPEAGHYAIKDSETGYALCSSVSVGPCFGAGNDMRIYSNALSTDRNHISGRSYVSSDGKYISGEEGNTIYFNVTDYVVLEAI